MSAQLRCPRTNQTTAQGGWTKLRSELGAGLIVRPVSPSY